MPKTDEATDRDKILRFLSRLCGWTVFSSESGPENQLMNFSPQGQGGLGRGERRHRGEEATQLTIADIKPGQAFRIIHLAAVGEIRRRLQDMGFIRGAIGRVLMKAPLRGPVELELLDYKISLRRAEARDILVEEI